MNCCGSSPQKEQKFQHQTTENSAGGEQIKNNNSTENVSITKSRLVLGLSSALVVGIAFGYFIK